MREGGWIQTYTGRQFWPLDPKPEEIFIEDIAHALSMKCRYGGHTRCFYSVAEHSVLVARQLPGKLKLAGLLHDASEAYLADVPRPLKKCLSGFHHIERAIEEAVAERFGLQGPWADEVHKVDDQLLATEKAAIMELAPAPWCELPEPLKITLPLWPPFYAEKMFLHTFGELTQERAA